MKNSGPGSACERARSNPRKKHFRKSSPINIAKISGRSKLKTTAHARDVAALASMVADEFVAAAPIKDRLQSKRSRMAEFEGCRRRVDSAGVPDVHVRGCRANGFRAQTRSRQTVARDPSVGE